MITLFIVIYLIIGTLFVITGLRVIDEKKVKFDASYMIATLLLGLSWPIAIIMFATSNKRFRSEK